MKKNIEQRKKEMDVIFDKLNNFGITEDFNNIKKFKDLSDDYIETGQSYSGKLLIEEINYMLIYILSNKKNIENNITLKKLNN